MTIWTSKPGEDYPWRFQIRPEVVLEDEEQWVPADELREQLEFPRKWPAEHWKLALDASGWDERYAGRELLWSAEPNRFVAEEVGGLAPGRALDLAAGEGRNAVWLAEGGWQVTAVDFSAIGLDKGRDLARRRGVDVDWVLADLAAWFPPPAAFDLVLLCYLHVDRALFRRVLRDAAEALAPGGVLLVIGHDRHNLTEGHGGPQDPAILYTPEEVAGTLEGLEVQRAERVLRPVALDDGGTASAIDTVVLAVRPSA